MGHIIYFLVFLSMAIIGNVYHFPPIDAIFAVVGGGGAGYKIVDVIRYFVERKKINKKYGENITGQIPRQEE